MYFRSEKQKAKWDGHKLHDHGDYYFVVNCTEAASDEVSN